MYHGHCRKEPKWDQKVVLKQGRTVFIPGGCGTVGAGLTRTLLQNGAKVVVSSRTQERLDGLKQSVDKALQSNLILIQEDCSTEAGAQKALEALKKQGGVQQVVASMGAWWMKGPLTKQSVEEYDTALNDRARCHFIVAKTFLPYLANIEGSTYTMLTGTSMETFVVPDISMILVADSCLIGISEALRAEFKDSNVIVNELKIGLFIKPMLDKEIIKEQQTMILESHNFDVIGNDLFADFMLSFLQSRPKGIIKIIKRTDLEAQKKQL